MPSLYWEEEIKTITKDWSFVWMLCEIIWHPATLSDLHRWFVDNYIDFEHNSWRIAYCKGSEEIKTIKYEPPKDLLDQSPETLKQLISLIKSYQ